MMSISKINEIVEENLVIDLEWLIDEFKILFNSKMDNHTEIDKKIANDILDYFLEIIDVADKVMLLRLLDKVIENVEKKYSKLLK